VKRDRIIVGLMSGTSVDAIDAAVVRVRGRAPQLSAVTLAHIEQKWTPALRKKILSVMAPANTTTQIICELNVEIATVFAHAALAVIRAAALTPKDITALASHGQTVCHLPPGTGRRGVASTLQLGDPSVIAALTGIQTIGNFRPADMAVGGQGAPLVPWADAALLSDRKITRCVQNLGGIGNVTYLPPLEIRGGVHRAGVIAFDTGPANVLIDAVVALASHGKRRFDRGGAMAARGVVVPALLRELQRHPYFRRKPPKSTGREEFGRAMAEGVFTANRTMAIDDLLATVTRLTAWSVVDAYSRYLPRLPDEIVLCGGGADNPTLVRMIAEELSTTGETVKLRRIDEFGIPNKAKEAASFALLGAATLDGVASNVPSVTGARHRMVLGVVAPSSRMTE
jgi:anhydro-N-acetylmuramic acid kinase